MPGALFWFAPLQREGMRSPGRKAGTSAVSHQPTNPLPALNEAPPHVIKPTKIRDVNFIVPARVHAAVFATSGENKGLC